MAGFHQWLDRRAIFDLSLYLVLDPQMCGGLDKMVETVKEAVTNGVTFVQLRSEAEIDKGLWYKAAVALKPILKAHNIPFVINDHVDVALAVDADGVHIGQKDLPATVVRKLLGEEKIIGLSVGSVEELKAVNFTVVDYVGVGPVFATTTKKDARPALGLDGLSAIVKAHACKKVAIGGINASNAESVMSTGVDGIAVVSAICGQEDVADATTLLATIVTTEQE
ncbi:thiamine phosphate synthase [Ignatzschineria larvae DSM 13226]|uniref:Thiamine-phosphate synthase n=1 Tax=Ignatzschineria larvae DSM 13226 TaxID=1111732 RepID=A0ABZ3C545_9GAMM|nr:thiamine phosphate synthase [Ignatzschineria larvae]